MDYEENIRGWIYVCCCDESVGSSTVITENTVLEKFILGKGKKTGNRDIILELGMKLLKENGVLFIILPSGYIGNKNKTYTELRSSFYSIKYWEYLNCLKTRSSEAELA
jgi:hypothetical protein